MTHQENAPLSVTPGAIRFNTDCMKLEYFRIGSEGGSTSSYAGIGTLAAGEWVQITTDSPDIQTGGTRGVQALGSDPAASQVTNFFNISTTGNATNFGNLVGVGRFGLGGCASRTRGYFVGGATPVRRPEIDTLVFASTGSCSDYGDLNNSVATTSCSSSTRGFALGGNTPSANIDTIEYFVLESTGTPVDFGNLIGTEGGAGGGHASSTRGIHWRSQSPNSTTIEFITMSTLGNAAEFGDMTIERTSKSACSNSVRGVCAGGFDVPGGSAINNIEYITIATLGDAIDFGDMSVNNPGNAAAEASSTRGVWSGGTDATMQYIQIMSTGNSVDFGDLTASATNGAACSNGHGGLG